MTGSSDTSPITADRWARLEPLLDAALDLAPELRGEFVREACAHDDELRAELEALIRTCERDDGFLALPATIAVPVSLADHAPPIRERLGAYQLVREIGRGGMATVYLADDLKHNRQVAIKVLHPHIARLIGHERFVREIEVAAKLSHPNILPLYDSGEASDDRSILYFVSPFSPGDSLRDLIVRTRRVPSADVVRLGREIALALDYAHRQNVIHLDIKPDSVLVRDGRAVIADFGIAHAISSVIDPRAGATTLLGTPPYMSPEHAAARDDVDGRSDIYSLGCVLYEMLTGEHPFERRLPDMQLLARYASPALVAVVSRAISADRERRFDTAGRLAQALTESL